jgi:formylglycine-generating enzyme required for sulfatase activity
VVSNVRAAQRPGTQLVDIYYDLADPDSASLAITVLVSTNGGASYTLPATSFSGSGWGNAVTPGINKQITWNAGADWSGQYSANVRFRVTADDAVAPTGMALIPAGSFTMGNCMSSSEGYFDELPLHTVYVSAFYMDKYFVTKSLWDTVYQWAIAHGYTFDYAGSGKAATHPVETIDWYDCVKWCNARSEKEGWVPAYYTDVGLSVRYRTGQVSVQTNWVNWGSGYRLPTEAEWEKAARGGASGHRFPWSNVDTITHSQANYYSSSSYAYDISPTRGYDPTANDGVFPYNIPVGYFAANGYGLYDMAGNVWQWCWDWYGSYSSGSQADPRGPASGSNRLDRGGGWGNDADGCRAAHRNHLTPDYWNSGIGFRSILPPGQQATSSADSNITTVDTRGVQAGTLTGLVQGNGTPLTNAQVRIDATPFTTNTAASGRFTLTTVPAGSGYLLKVSAAGFASKSVPGITVTAGTTDLGTITLGTTTGPYQIIPLAPDVNPATTTVEQGGTAYRYYLMQNSAGKPQGGVAVSVQVAGGSPIPQAQDVSSYWPGQVAGTSDADGIVRIAIPSSALGAPGTIQTIQLSLAGQVQQTFKAQAVPRQYDQVWKQILGGGVSVGELLTAEADTSAESDLRHQMSNGTVVGETISRVRQAKLKAGVGFDVGASCAATLTAGAGVSVGTTLSSTYSFDPNTTDPSQNAMKLYVDLGNVLSGLPGPANAFYNFAETSIEPSFLGPNLTDVEADVQAGLYADATLDLGLPFGQKTEIGVEGSASASEDAIYGYEQTFGSENEWASVKGLVATVTADLSAQAGFTPVGANKPNTLAYSLFSVGLAAEQTVKDWT